MERRQAAAAEREARKAARLALKERQDRERNTKLKMEEEAYEMQLQVTYPTPYSPSYSLPLEGGWEEGMKLFCNPSEKKHKLSNVGHPSGLVCCTNPHTLLDAAWDAAPLDSQVVISVARKAGRL